MASALAVFCPGGAVWWFASARAIATLIRAYFTDAQRRRSLPFGPNITAVMKSCCQGHLQRVLLVPPVHAQPTVRTLLRCPSFVVAMHRHVDHLASYAKKGNTNIEFGQEDFPRLSSWFTFWSGFRPRRVHKRDAPCFASMTKKHCLWCSKQHKISREDRFPMLCAAV